jgi:hypothetical protein
MKISTIAIVKNPILRKQNQTTDIGKTTATLQNLNGKLFFVLAFNIGQMTLPTIEFFANCKTMVATSKACRGGPTFLTMDIHAFLAILAPTLFVFETTFICACTDSVLTH